MYRLFSGPPVRWPRFVGGALLAAGLLGILLSFAGMIVVTVGANGAQRALVRELTTLDRALTATDEGLKIAGAALGDAEQTLGSLSGTIGEATRAISDTAPTLETLQELTATTLPESITATRQALDSAQQTALVADQVLGALSFLGLNYNPEVPLNTAIARVSASLEPVPADLVNVSAGLTTAQANLAELTASLEEVGAGIEGIQGSVSEATGVVTEYREIVAGLRGELATIGATAPGWIRWLSWWAFGFLAAIALGQIGLLVQGWGLLRRD